MKILEVQGLSKAYAQFKLNNVSFSLEEGHIVGFIGRNGAGKTTTLKSILNIVHPDAGSVRFFGEPYAEHEQQSKQRLGFVSGGINYYPKKKLRAIAAVCADFYPTWDGEKYREYLRRFALDENKTPSELSEGMKVKFSLALALSHRAELLLLDEPTSGLDPVSRDELLDIFLQLAEKEKVTILFSTHITSDLDKCADDILYIKQGEIFDFCPLDDFLHKFRLVTCTGGQGADAHSDLFLGTSRSRSGYTALVRAEDAGAFAASRQPDLGEIMVHVEKEEAEI